MNPQIALDRQARAEEFQRKHRIGLLTLVFTDMVGSTQLKQQYGDHQAAESIQQHHALVREIVRQFQHADEIETAGDSFLLVFAKPSDAVKFALVLQARLRALARETGKPVFDRIGIHAGEVFVQEQGDSTKLFGMQVDLCARVMALAQGNQILMSRFVFDNARQALRGADIEALRGLDELRRLDWLNHGTYLLKGIEEPLEICEVGVAGTSPLAPPSNSDKARRHLLSEDEPVLGWRPALEQVVPNTKWILERKLGEGGFGEVWLGRHETLKERRVFKFCFRADRVRSLKREVTLFRLLKERVGHHPNIVGIQEVFFDQPPYYIVMDYAAGQDLRGWCETQGGVEKIPLATRLEIVAQVADALQAAHDAGVIHRDVKPSNILVSTVAAAVKPRADLAAPRGPNASAEQSQPAASQPQLRVRLTDFGIGQVVSQEALAGLTRMGFTQTMMAPGSSSQTGTQLYMAPELLAGKPASSRSDIYSLGVVLYQLLVGEFTHPVTTDWGKRISDTFLREDLEKCFAGDPEERFLNAGQLATKLRGFDTRHAALVKKQAESEAREEVARRRTVMRKAVASISAIVLAIVLAGYAVKRVEQARMTREARKSYEKGEEAFFRWSTQDAETARKYFNQAIEKDGHFAPAYAALAMTYLQGSFGTNSREQRLFIARENIRKAQKLDNRSGEVHTALAQLKFAGDWDLSAAETEFKLALQLSPNYGVAHHFYSHYLMAVGRIDEALTQAKLFLELDRLSAPANLHLGWSYLMAGQFDKAIEQQNLTLKITPNYQPAYRHLSLAYVGKKNYREGIVALRNAMDLSPNDVEYKALLGYAYALDEQRAEAQKILDDLTELKKNTIVDSYALGLICLGLGQGDQAMKWLQRAWEERSSDNLGIVYIKVDTAVESLHSDPRFTELLKKMKLEK